MIKIKITEKMVIIERENNHTTSKRKTSAKTPGYRDILFFDDIVIKFDAPHRGHFGTQCQNEVEKYMEIEEEDKKYFATVLDSGDGWVAMERVFFDNPNSYSNYSKNSEAYKIKYYLQNKYNLGDLHSGNWGIKENGEPIIFDYGVNP